MNICLVAIRSLGLEKQIIFPENLNVIKLRKIVQTSGAHREVAQVLQDSHIHHVHRQLL